VIKENSKACEEIIQWLLSRNIEVVIVTESRFLHVRKFPCLFIGGIPIYGKEAIKRQLLENYLNPYGISTSS
jgi:hypothetical protein